MGGATDWLSQSYSRRNLSLPVFLAVRIPGKETGSSIALNVADRVIKRGDQKSTANVILMSRRRVKGVFLFRGKSLL